MIEPKHQQVPRLGSIRRDSSKALRQGVPLMRLDSGDQVILVHTHLREMQVFTSKPMKGGQHGQA